MIEDFEVGSAVVYFHAECIAIPPLRRCRKCRRGGVPVIVSRLPETRRVQGSPVAFVKDGLGPEFAAYASELQPALTERECPI